MKALSQPLFASLQGYDRQQLGPDLFSGVLIALLSIPISMGYAQLAGLPPVYGLYGSLIPILLFAMLSTTREFIFGVDAAPAAMIGAVLASLGAAPGGAEAMRIVPVLTLYVALWLAVFALVRADKAVDYISEPVMGGFISGVCCEIILMQVPKLLGSGTGTGELFELLEHIFDAAKAVNLPIILYNIPGRCGCGISEHNVERLAAHPNIMGIKEASGDVAYAAKIAHLLSDDFRMYSGEDALTVPLMSLGASGTISVWADVQPQLVHDMCHAYLDGDVERARDIQIAGQPLINALFSEVNPIPVKEALAQMGMI